MKTTLSVLAISLFLTPLVTSHASADCNLKVARSAGLYISELEKAGLQKYQNSSVCEVLEYEFWNCSRSQKANLEKSFKLKEVLGNYCQPHLRPPTALVKNEFMKGADLYSWKDSYGYFWYALLPGASALRTSKLLIESRISEGYLKEIIGNIPPGTGVTWNNMRTVDDSRSLEFVVPPDGARNIRAKAVLAKLKLEVPKEETSPQSGTPSR